MPNMVSQVTPAGCKIFSGSAAEMSSLLGDYPAVALGLVDGALTTDLGALFEGLGVTQVYFTQRMHRKLPGWNNANVFGGTLAGGGGRGGHSTLAANRRNERKKTLGRPTFRPPLAPRDGSTVLSCTPQHYSVRGPPPLWHLPDGVCENLGDAARPVYHHGGGWLPAGVIPETWALAPGIYAPKGTWVLRALTFGEYFSAHDAPETLIRLLRDDLVLGADPSLASMMVPGKCLVAGFRLFNGGGTSLLEKDDTGSDEKGMGMAEDDSLLTEAKGNEEENEEQGDICQGDIHDGAKGNDSLHAQGTAPGGRLFDQAKLAPPGDVERWPKGTAPDRNFADRANLVHEGVNNKDSEWGRFEGNCRSSKGVTPVSTLPKLDGNRNSQGGSWDGTREDNPIFRPPPSQGSEIYSVPQVKSPVGVRPASQQGEALDAAATGNREQQEEALDDGVRQKREQKATKADNAEVPEYIWEEHLLNDGPTPWVIEDRARLRRAMDLLWQRMLRWWKQKVTTTFIVWAHKRYPKLEPLDEKYGSEVGRVGSRYRWTRNDPHLEALGGREAYREWWKCCSLLAGKDLYPAADAIARAARSSWWNWDDGSRPFHWRWPAWYMGIIRDGLPVYF
jgi:hypothetical protein